MNFTTGGYIGLLKTLCKNKYRIANYLDWQKYDKCVILRHDVDFDLQQAYSMAQLEYKHGIRSTYFIMLTGSFYNMYSMKNRSIIHNIQDMGHTIGVHFDEMAYPDDVGNVNRIKRDIKKELEIMTETLNMDIVIFSYHRPSKAILESNLQLQGSINSYGNIFFNQFKYLSDSRMNWREPVIDIIEKNEYSKLHILTHPFWYHDNEMSIQDVLEVFIKRSVVERYNALNDNFTKLESIIKWEDMNL